MALFDDDHRNVACAVAAGYRGAVVRPGEGISCRSFAEYLARADAGYA